MGGRHTRWMNTARRLARKSRFPGYRMSAVLVKGGRIISQGLNRLGPGILKHRAYLYIEHGRGGCQNIHAELDALMDLDPAEVRGAELYVAGYTVGGNTAISKPCKQCQEMLKSYELVVYYQDYSGNVFAMA